MKIIIHQNIGLIAFVPMLTVAAWAQSPVTLDTDKAIQLAFQNNHAIRIAAQEEAQAELRLKWAGRLANPELGLDYQDDALGQDENEGSFGLAITQELPLSSRRGDEKRLSLAQLDLTRAELADQRRQLAHAVDKAMIQLALVRGAIAFERELEALNTEIVDFLSLQVERGEASALELTQTILTGRILAQQVQTQEAEARRQTIQLKQLLGLDSQTEIILDNFLTLPKQAPAPAPAIEALLSNRPDYLVAQARMAQAEGALELEKSKRWEDVSFRIFMERERAIDTPGGLERNTLAGMGITIPLPIVQRNQDGIAAAMLTRETASLSIQALQFRIRNEYDQARQSCTDTYEVAKTLSKELLTLADRNFADLRRAYENGQASLFQVQQAQEQVLELKSSTLAAIAAYHTAESVLRFATGNTPRPTLAPTSTDPNHK
ncbi:MAG: TolC family protein [Verrucomicrobia bacterium]|nr:TolC family protein [Verrucomicrobiota bacterium]